MNFNSYIASILNMVLGFLEHSIYTSLMLYINYQKLSFIFKQPEQLQFAQNRFKY